METVNYRGLIKTMSGFENWEKIYEDDSIIEFQNTAVGMITVVEGGDGEWEAYTRHSNPAIDGEHLGVGNKKEAQEMARDYRANNTFSQYESSTAAAETALLDMFPQSVIDQDKIDVEVWSDEVVVSVNTYNYLKGNLNIGKTEQMFRGMMTMIMEEQGMSGYEAIQHMTGENVEYTYNREVAIHPDFQYCLFNMTSEGEPIPMSEFYDAEYIAIQIHTGRDARVGFSKFMIFELDYFDIGSFISDMTDLRARTANGERSWWSDDSGYHWYGDDGDTPDIEYDEIPEYWDLDKETDTVTDKETGSKVEFSSPAI